MPSDAGPSRLYLARPASTPVAGKSVASPLLTCPYAPQAKPKPTVPCDLTQISMTLTPKTATAGKTGVEPPVTVQNSRATIALAPGHGLSADDVGRMAGKAVYIHLMAAFTAPPPKGPAGQAANNSFNAPTRSAVNDRKKIEATLQAKVVAAQRCGQHPADTVTHNGKSDAAQKADQTAALAMKIEPMALDLARFVKLVFHPSDWSRPGATLADEIVVNFESCGAPAKGPGHAQFLGMARVSSLDDWSVALSWPGGWKLAIGRKTETTTDHLNDAKIRRTETTNDKTTKAVESGLQGGVRQYSRLEKDGELVEGLSQSYQGADNALLRNRYESYQLRAGAKLLKQVLFEDELAEAKKEATATKLIKKMTLTVVVNGESLSTKDLTEFVDNISDSVFKMLDTVGDLYRIIKGGLEVGFPITVDLEAGASLIFLDGNVMARRWWEPRPALKGPGYYVSGAEPQWRLSVDLAPLAVSGNLMAGVNLHLFSSLVAKLGVSITLTAAIAPRVRFAVAKGDPSRSILLETLGSLIVTAKGDGNVGPYYVSAEGTARGALRLTRQFIYDGKTLDPQPTHLTNERCDFKLKVFKGDKLQEMFNPEGQGDPWYSYPKTGTLKLVKEGALDKTF